MSPGLRATFLTCCVPVNSCSITSMTVVHFLHQTDIGSALRKHKAIYSISPTLFSPFLALPAHFLSFSCFSMLSASPFLALLAPSQSSPPPSLRPALSLFRGSSGFGCSSLLFDYSMNPDPNPNQNRNPDPIPIRNPISNSIRFNPTLSSVSSGGCISSRNIRFQ